MMYLSYGNNSVSFGFVDNLSKVKFDLSNIIIEWKCSQKLSLLDMLSSIDVIPKNVVSLISNPTIFKPSSIIFKDSLCSDICINSKIMLFDAHIWEFVGRFNNISTLSFIYNQKFHLFLAVSSMAFLSQKFGAIFSLFIHTSLALDPSSNSLFWRTISLANFYRLVAAILWLIQAISGSYFDWLGHRIYIRKNLELSLWVYLLVGIIYLVNIITGILFTNALWFLVNPTVNNLHALFIGSLFTVVLSGLWYKIRRSVVISDLDFLNSVFRSLVDVMLFIAVCASTYGSWNIFLQNVPTTIAYPIGIALGFVCHYVSGYFLIGLEFNESPGILYGILYGVLYLVWWSSAIFNTNSLVGLFIEHLPYALNSHYWIISIILSSISVVVNYPYYYLNGVGNVTSNINSDIELSSLGSQSPTTVTHLSILNRLINYITRNHHVILIRLFICIFSYCLCGGLLWELIVLRFV